MLRLPYFTRFSRLRQGQWMGRSIQEMKFLHHPRNFIQTLLKSRPSSISTPYRDQQRWVSTKKTAKKAHEIKSDELSGVDNYVGLLEYLRKDHVLELETHQFGMFRVGSSSWRPDIKVKQALERKLSVLPASQLLEMPAKDRSEILGYLNLLKFSNLSFVGKVKEWLMKVKRMHEEQRIGSDEGRVLVFHLLWIVPPHTLKQELEELSKSYLIQKKDFQSLVEYSNYLSLLRKLSHLLRVNLKDDFSDLLKFQDELNELPVLELLRFFKFHISTLRQEINNQTKELIASSMRKILSSNLILPNSEVLSIMDIREALGILFDNEEALDFMPYVRDMQAMKRMVKLVKPLNSFQLCDDERASIFKEKINASITAAFWEGSLADRDFSTFIKIVDSTFLTPSSLILIKNADKEVKDISGDDQEVIVSTIPSYLQRDQIEATGLSALSKALEFNVTIDDFTESTKALFVQLLVNDVQKKDSPTNTSQVLVLLYKLQYKWSDLTRRAQERLTYFLTSPSNSFSIDDEISKSLMHYLPILCFDSEQATNTSLNLPLMKVNICLLRGISKKYQDSSASFSVGLYIKWLQTLPLAVQKLLLSSSGIRQFPKIKMDSPPLNVKQSEFINGCNKYLSQHLVQAQDMKDRKIMISDVNTPVKSFPMHLTVECNGKVIACIQLLKERIKVRDGEMKMDREDKLRDYLCYHTYGNVPIIHIEFEDYSKLEVGEDVFKEIENVVRSLIQ